MATTRKHGCGDGGFTSLPEGGVVPKTHPRVRYFCALDELSCRLGLARTAITSKADAALLMRFQKALLLACSGRTAPALKAELRYLDSKTASLEKKLPPLKRFVLPGSSPAEAALHSARSACRAAELKAWVLQNNSQAGAYLNRLSSCLFALARLYSVK